MALDILMAASRGTCALIKQQCCVHTPNCSGKLGAITKEIEMIASEP